MRIQTTPPNGKEIIAAAKHLKLDGFITELSIAAKVSADLLLALIWKYWKS